MPAPGVELALIQSHDGNLMLTAPMMVYSDENEEIIKHIINMVLQIFKECQFFTENLEAIVETPIESLTWEILPPGPHPGERLREFLNPVFEKAKKGRRPFLEHRLKTINEFQPIDSRKGTGGFGGYVIFLFPEKGIRVFESAFYGNATYILGEDWEELSRLSKVEILNADLHLERIVHHRENWEARIRELLS